MLLSILLALITSNKALDSCIGDDWTAPAGLWGGIHHLYHINEPLNIYVYVYVYVYK